MIKKLLVLSPVGTSILSNVASSREAKTWVNIHANAKSTDEIPPQIVEELMSLMNEATHKIKSASLSEVASTSAELNAIIHLYGSQFGEPKQRGDYHLLLSTDTWLGECCAVIASEWLNAQGISNVEVRRQRDMRAVSLEELQEAFAEIVRWCDTDLHAFQQNGFRIIFNLTGGFKGIQGFLQTLASFYADETIYIFEKSDLIRIPRLPIKMDADEFIQRHLSAFRRLSLGLKVSLSDVEGIPEIFLMSMDNALALSSWGELVWNQSRRNVYSSTVHPVSSERIRFAKTFADSVRNLQPDRVAHINERIDDLAVFLETNQNVKRLDFKPLAGTPKLPSTHEMDAWADLDARRLFGHFEGSVFVIDRLDRALH